MSKAFLITGFNNWGKTRIINELFNKKNEHSRFKYGKPYPLNGFENKKYYIVVRNQMMIW
jgi:hypothetical protein